MKISIVTITYNSSKTIIDTFESILGQLYRPLEYVIVDGGSTDSTLNIIKSYEKKFIDKGIEYRWSSGKDNGISDAFNKGIINTTGEIIGIINSDDKLNKNALNAIYEKYDEKTDVYYGNCIIFSNENKDEYIAIPKFSKNERSLFMGMSIYHPATFITKKAYNKYGLYNEMFRMFMDRELLLRFYTKKADFKYIDYPLACYREGGTNQINYDKTAEENMNISVLNGFSSRKAKLIRMYFKMHDKMWLFTKKIGLEKLFHKKI